MKLKNVLITADDVDLAVRFYHDMFGLQVMLDRDGNVMMTEGLVIQDRKVWEKALEKKCSPENNMAELYFETSDIDGFAAKLAERYGDIKCVTELTKQPDGSRVMRIYDPSGNLIEIRETKKYDE